MANIITGDLKSEDLRICIISSRFNEPVTENLIQGALTAMKNNGIDEKNIDIVYVPGAFEIPAVYKTLCRQNTDRKKYDGFITVGCVIKGETAHFEYISESVTDSINKISYDYEIPSAFCVLTCYTPLQAHQRSIIPPDAVNNKGFESALTLLEMINLLKKL